MSHQVITSGRGALFLVREGSCEDPERRRRAAQDWKLIDPPQMYVICRDEQYDCFRIEPVHFAVAKALAPREFGNLMDRLTAARESEWSAHQELRQAKKDDTNG